MAPAPAVQRETISAALTLLVIVASAAISLLRLLLSVGRLALLPATATGDEGRKAVDVAVVLGWATLLLRLRPALLLIARRIELGVARQIRLRVAWAVGRLLLLMIAELRGAVVIPLIEGFVAATHVRAAAFRPIPLLEIRIALPELLLSCGNQAQIVLRVLRVVFGRDRIA